MKWLLGAFLLVAVYLQCRLWIGEGSLAHLTRLHHDIQKQESENARLQERNRLLIAEVTGLKNEDDAMEERARNDLGMIRKGETFFMVMQPQAEKKSSPAL
jgi:cell division protein FtsB